MFYIFLVFYTYPAINEDKKKHTEQELVKKVRKVKYYLSIVIEENIG